METRKHNNETKTFSKRVLFISYDVASKKLLSFAVNKKYENKTKNNKRHQETLPNLEKTINEQRRRYLVNNTD